MRYVHVEVEHIGQAQWVACVREFGLFVSESSKPRLEYETYRRVEECEGLHAFTLVWPS